MSSKLIVSFCNVSTKGLALGIYDYEDDDFNWINLSKQNDINGVTGITFSKDRLWFLVQKVGGGSELRTINNNFELEKIYPLQKTKDAHSIIPFDDGFLVNDSMHNRVNKLEVINNKDEVKEIEFWKYKTVLYDRDHINSICKKNNKIFVSMIGTKHEQGWKFTISGKILEIMENNLIYENLHHPHTLTTIGNDMYWLESRTGNVHKFSEKQEHEIVLKLDGYIRGMAFDENYLYIGSSARRRRSKSSGTRNVPEAISTDDAQSWVYRVDRKTLEFQRKSLAIFGEEIYDLMIFNKEYHFSKKDNPIIQRLWKYQDEIEDYKNKLIQSSQIERKLKNTEKELSNIKNSQTWKLLQNYLRFRKFFNRKNS